MILGAGLKGKEEPLLFYPSAREILLKEMSARLIVVLLVVSWRQLKCLYLFELAAGNNLMKASGGTTLGTDGISFPTLLSRHPFLVPPSTAFILLRARARRRRQERKIDRQQEKDEEDYERN